MTYNVTDGHQDLLERLREKVFSLPLLPQVHVIEYFHALDASLDASVTSLLSKGSFVETYLADVVSEVAASLTHGRTIYSRTTSIRRKKGEPEPPPAKPGTPGEVFKRSSDIVFLEQSINILRLLAHYQDRDPAESMQHKEQTKQVLREIKFVRLVYEDVLGRFLAVTDGYTELAALATETHNRMRDAKSKPAFQKDMQTYAELHGRLQEIEDEIQVDRAYVWHLRTFIERQSQYQSQLRNAIHEPYLRIVYKEAKRHATTTQQILDNFQNGSTGLLRAISCYNIEKNVSFSSYAHWWIRQSILFHIKDSSNFVKLPVTTWQTYTAVEKKRAKVYARDGDDSIEALARETGHSVEKITEVFEAVHTSHVHSLQYEVDEDGKMMLIDVIPDTAIEERERLEDIEQDVESRLRTLTAEQRWMMRLHYGMVGKLDPTGKVTQADIMREKIRQRLAAVEPSLIP